MYEWLLAPIMATTGDMHAWSAAELNSESAELSSDASELSSKNSNGQSVRFHGGIWCQWGCPWPKVPPCRLRFAGGKLKFFGFEGPIRDMDTQMMVLRVIWPKCTFHTRKALFLCIQVAKVCVSVWDLVPMGVPGDKGTSV